MKRPITVKIFGQKYKVKYDQKGDDFLGTTSSNDNTIHIRDGMQDDKTARVFMHEVTHAILHESTLGDRKRFDVEEVCDIVGYHIVDMLCANQDIAEWILKEND